jgi:hypothetical protein
MALETEISTSIQIKEAMYKVKKNIEFSRNKVPNLEQLILNEVKFPDIQSFEIKSTSL